MVIWIIQFLLRILVPLSPSLASFSASKWGRRRVQVIWIQFRVSESRVQRRIWLRQCHKSKSWENFWTWSNLATGFQGWVGGDEEMRIRAEGEEVEIKWVCKVLNNEVHVSKDLSFITTSPRSFCFIPFVLPFNRPHGASAVEPLNYNLFPQHAYKLDECVNLPKNYPLAQRQAGRRRQGRPVKQWQKRAFRSLSRTWQSVSR